MDGQIEKKQMVDKTLFSETIFKIKQTKQADFNIRWKILVSILKYKKKP